MEGRHRRFGLTLMVNHACNLRCTYCYTGEKFSAPMPASFGETAIDRALQSLLPDGRLDLGFFGGEPLLESTRILAWMTYARTRSLAEGRRARFSLTTNGTVVSEESWQIMTAPDLQLAVSFDGHPGIHDRHRRTPHGQGSAARVEATLCRLLEQGIEFRVNTVVRPDNLEELPEGLRHLHSLGVRQVDLSLDLWTTWTADDGRRLETLIENAARLWREWLPQFSLNWFDVKVGDLAALPRSEEGHACGFGEGEIAVAPSGRLYPCERLIGADAPDHPHQLPGHVLDGLNSLGSAPPPFSLCAPCSACGLASVCDTRCRCSNLVRTGDRNRPDGLLCLLNKATAQAVSEVLANGGPFETPFQTLQSERLHHAQ